MSKKTGKPVLVNFTGSDWCTWCHKLEGEVFATKDFKTWASKNVILLELDFPQAKKLPDALKKQNDDLSKKYKVEGFPTILFLDASGKELGRSGYMKGGPKAWLKNAEKFTAKKVKK
jgi:protein disulfide-isomerase